MAKPQINANVQNQKLKNLVLFQLSSNQDFFYLIFIIPSFIKYSIPSINAESGISPSAHHPALFFTHSGIVSLGIDSALANAIMLKLEKITTINNPKYEYRNVLP